MGQAIASFLSATEKVQRVLDLEAQYHDPPLPGEVEVVDGLRAAAAVLMVAIFEQFLRDLFLEHIGTLSARLGISALSPALITKALYGTLEYAMRRRPGDPDSYRDSRQNEIQDACAHVVSDKITPEAFLPEGNNPTSEAVSRAFRKIGLQDCFQLIHLSFHSAWGAPISTKFIADNLNQIVARRHRAAHTGDGLSISRLELSDGLRFMTILCGHLDTLLALHVASL